MQLTNDEQKVIDKIREVCNDTGYGTVTVTIHAGGVHYSKKEIGEKHWD